MNTFIIGLVYIFVSFSTFASTCPLEDFEGEFKVVEVQGCDNTPTNFQVKYVKNVVQADMLEFGVAFNYDNNPSRHMYFSREIKQFNA